LPLSRTGGKGSAREENQKGKNVASVYRRKPGGVYYVTYMVRPGQRRTVKACRDRAASDALARKLEADALLRREGIIDPKADQYSKAEARRLVVKDAAGKVVDGHVADFHTMLLAKGTTAKHAQMTQARVLIILGKCGTERLSDLAASKVQAAVAALRDVEGVALQTCNYYLRATKQFSRWIWRDGRAREDALMHLTGYNAQLDRRHDRRVLTDEELSRLITAAEKGRKVRAMTGPERAMLYHQAVGTGFRAKELRSLTPESFDLEANTPTVTVQAAYSKHRRKDIQPIRRDLADLLKPWLMGKTAGCPVFQMPDKAIKLIRTDLDVAREAWLDEARSEEQRQALDVSDFLKYRDSAGHVVDFHALRHTYISRLVASGANIKVAQELARHSTPTLTLGRYAHVQLVDQTRALWTPCPPSRPHGPTWRPRPPSGRKTYPPSGRTSQPPRAALFQRPFSAHLPRHAMTCHDLPRSGVR
jgi:integrase